MQLGWPFANKYRDYFRPFTPRKLGDYIRSRCPILIKAIYTHELSFEPVARARADWLSDWLTDWLTLMRVEDSCVVGSGNDFCAHAQLCLYEYRKWTQEYVSYVYACVLQVRRTCVWVNVWAIVSVLDVEIRVNRAY